MAAAMSRHPSWPAGPAEPAGWAEGEYPDDDGMQANELPDQALADEGPAHAVIGEMTGLLRDTRANLLTGGAVLGAVIIGMALEAAFSARGTGADAGAVRVVNVGLLGALLLCALRAGTLLVLAGRPVLNALSELRWATGAPVDPRPRWVTVPPVEADPAEWTWIRAHLLLSAARLARYRAQLADTWTYATAAGFLLWTAAILLGL
jgi:hypothetical protein